MRAELVDTSGNRFLTITLDDRNQWIQANWQGSLTEVAVKAGMQAYTEALEEADYNALLIDTRSAEGCWSHSLDWALNVWAPQAAAAGLQYYALVVNPASLKAASTDGFYAQVQWFEAEVFADLATARAWLRRKRYLKENNSYLHS
ncbi:STAS/SEC14 domain-containing protein [Rufibacter psychrotolerans]|uniref:STAS/SEC14 domain-containing protein n=1 Tax=Rufibacter psychrotolerans TaxID=2812556 RepID=UPI001967CC66|nr:STAS/SEC14 domain-containing protein [Rufibacter sp. SYSU D00308]